MKYSKISKDDIAKIRERKASLSKKLIVRLDAALAALSRSNRFSFFETMEISLFTAPDGKPLGALKEMSFGRLVEEGTIEICLDPSMGPGRVKRLAEIIENLLVGEEPNIQSLDENGRELPSFVTAIVEGGSQKNDFRMKHLRKDVPLFGSVEAERKLSEAIGRLRKCPELDRFGHEKLSQYWDPTITSAPFIEELTVHELVDLNLDTLLKKRSFGNRKIFALLAAIDTCLSRELSDGKRQDTLATVVDFRSASEHMKPNVGTHEKVIWREPKNPLPAFSKGILLYVQRSTNESSFELGNCRRILRAAIREMSPEQFLALWLKSELGKGFDPHLAGIDENQKNAVLCSGIKQFEGIVSSEVKGVLESWDSMLQSSAVPEEKLMITLLDSGLDDILVHVIGKMILEVSAAQQARAFGYTLSGYWTKRPQSLELVLNTLLKGMPKKAQVLSHELGALLPFIRPEHIEPILQTVAMFDGKTGEWKAKDTPSL